MGMCSTDYRPSCPASPCPLLVSAFFPLVLSFLILTPTYLQSLPLPAPSPGSCSRSSSLSWSWPLWTGVRLHPLLHTTWTSAGGEWKTGRDRFFAPSSSATVPLRSGGTVASKQCSVALWWMVSQSGLTRAVLRGGACCSLSTDGIKGWQSCKSLPSRVQATWPLCSKGRTGRREEQGGLLRRTPWRG